MANYIVCLIVQRLILSILLSTCKYSPSLLLLDSFFEQNNKIESGEQLTFKRSQRKVIFQVSRRSHKKSIFNSYQNRLKARVTLNLFFCVIIRCFLAYWFQVWRCMFLYGYFKSIYSDAMINGNCDKNKRSLLAFCLISFR